MDGSHLLGVAPSMSNLMFVYILMKESYDHLKTVKCSRLDCNGGQGFDLGQNGWEV